MAQTTRRVVTGHDANGKAIVLQDGVAPNLRVRDTTGIASTLLWAVDESPPDISGGVDRADRTLGVPPPPNGSVFRIVEFPPLGAGKSTSNEAILREMGVAGGHAAARSPFMHRTRSIDYAIVLSGRIKMLLDDSEVDLVAGDTVVQQGTNHAWENHGGEPCRIAFVLIDANPPAQWRGAEI